MSNLQTTIPFIHRKLVTNVHSKNEEKENALGTKPSPKKKNIGSPIRESNGQNCLKRTSKDEGDAKGCSPPKQKNTANDEIALSSAIKALHSSESSKLPGREDKLDEMTSIFCDCLDNRSSKTIYVSGPPGTGKTACLNHIIQIPKFSRGFKVVYINCTGIRSAGSVYQRVADDLNLKPNGKTEKSYQNAIHNHLLGDHKMILLILDEIDQLESKKQSILYSIFEWPSLPNSKIVLVGIANALDLTDRILPRLKANVKFQPTVIPFAPYSKQQIINILTERLREAEVENVLTGGALQLLASKLAAISGDIRRALDLARRVVELTGNKEENGKTVSLQEVLSVVNNVYISTGTLSTAVSSNSSEPFPIQQKLLICTTLLIRRHSKLKELTLGKLHDVYRKVCEKRNFSVLGLSEFISLAELVESRGVIKMKGKIRNRMSKVIMQWDEDEATIALKDKELLASIIIDNSCL